MHARQKFRRVITYKKSSRVRMLHRAKNDRSGMILNVDSASNFCERRGVRMPLKNEYACGAKRNIF